MHSAIPVSVVIVSAHLNSPWSFGLVNPVGSFYCQNRANFEQNRYHAVFIIYFYNIGIVNIFNIGIFYRFYRIIDHFYMVYITYDKRTFATGPNWPVTSIS